MHRIRILDVHVDNVGRDEAISIAKDFISDRKPHLVVTLNALIAHYARGDKDFANLINNAHLTIADGAGIVWAARFLGSALRGRVPGIDLMNELFLLACKCGYKVYLLGSQESVIEEAVRRLKERFPALQIVGWHNGYLDPGQSSRVVDEIRRHSPDMLFVGMGAGRQEKWLRDNLKRLDVPLCMGVGGSFDVLSGRLNRAPRWMRKWGMEWVYRTVREPRRVQNVISGLARFTLGVIGQRFYASF